MLKKSLMAGLTVLIATLAMTASAHKGASGIVKKRMDIMSDVAENMKTIGKMMKAETAFDASLVIQAANAIANHSQEIPHLFPEGSNKKPSEALPRIWAEWDRFIELAAKMETSAQSLGKSATTAQNTNDIRNAFVTLGKTCKACHADFRVPKS